MPTTGPSPFLNLYGAPGSRGQGAFGLVPQVPNPVATANQAIGGNIGNIPGIMSIINAADPHYQQEQNLTGDWLTGVVPQDVRNLLSQQGAERGVRMGSPGSPNANAAWLRALGFTSTGLQAQGMSAANALSGRTFGQMSPFFVSPEQQQAAQTAANVYSAAPDPADQAAYLRNLYSNMFNRPAPSGGGGPSFGSPAYQSPNYSRQPSAPTSPGAPGNGYGYLEQSFSPDDAANYVGEFWNQFTPEEQDQWLSTLTGLTPGGTGAADYGVGSEGGYDPFAGTYDPWNATSTDMASADQTPQGTMAMPYDPFTTQYEYDPYAGQYWDQP